MKKAVTYRACLLFLLAAVLIAGDSSRCFAAKAFQLHIENVRVDGSELLIYLNDSLGGAKKSAFSVTLGSQELPVKKLLRFSKLDEPAAYIFLADVSGSISSEKLQEMKDYMKCIADRLRPQDQVCVVTLGNDVSVGAFTQGKKKVKKQIDQIQGLSDDTNLYYGITESLKVLDSDVHGAHKRALVIFSDGHDEQVTGITREEVNDCIKETGIPVYTVAMLQAGDSTQMQDFAKILGSFARISAGGLHITYGIEELTMEQGASRMLDAFMGGYVLSADLSGYKPGDGQAYLQVTRKAKKKGTATASDGRMVKEPASDAAGKSDSKQAGEPIAAEADKEGSQNYMIAAGIAAAVVILLALVLFSRKKKQNVQQQEMTPTGLEADIPPQNTFSPPEEIQEIYEQRSPFVEPDRIVFLAKVGVAEKRVYEVAIKGEAAIGRVAEKADYAFPEDPRLSAVHCLLRCEGDKVLIQDAGSKNGTQVNGVPIMGSYALQRDDIIRIGQTELRIYW